MIAHQTMKFHNWKANLNMHGVRLSGQPVFLVFGTCNLFPIHIVFPTFNRIKTLVRVNCVIFCLVKDCMLATLWLLLTHHQALGPIVSRWHGPCTSKLSPTNVGLWPYRKNLSCINISFDCYLLLQQWLKAIKASKISYPVDVKVTKLLNLQ